IEGKPGCRSGALATEARLGWQEWGNAGYAPLAEYEWSMESYRSAFGIDAALRFVPCPVSLRFMAFAIDLDAYFARIGDSGARGPDLATLRRVVEAHARTIPFENLDILRGRGISVELADIERKLVHEGRGGYCFEQNSLMEQVLQGLGFDVQAISARVRIKSPRSFIPARTHMFLRVCVGGEDWLVDVGVGGLTPNAPLRLVLDEPQDTPLETRRIVAEGQWSGFEQRSPDALLYHQVLIGDEWQDVCEFTLEPMYPIDRELGNWFTSAHPASHFKDKLSVARTTENGRVTILNQTLKFRDENGQAQSRILNTRAELLEALDREFDLQFPADTVFQSSGLANLKD
ncbi:MAG: arylamine N-acetyltransferase, partial [Planctomycetota bacterium]|nr:arylamine N-acetyltransferase [Planctomycetota bacterium]